MLHRTLTKMGVLKALAAAGVLLAISFLGHPAQAQPTCQQISPLPGVIYGQVSGTCYDAQVNSSHELKVTGTFTPSATPAPQQVGITPTDRTITSATGASQTVMAANAARHGLIIQNTGNANCGVNPTGGTAAIGGAGTLTLLPGGSYQPRIPTLSAVTAICTAAQPLYAEEN